MDVKVKKNIIPDTAKNGVMTSVRIPSLIKTGIRVAAAKSGLSQQQIYESALTEWLINNGFSAEIGK